MLEGHSNGRFIRRRIAWKDLSSSLGLGSSIQSLQVLGTRFPLLSPQPFIADFARSIDFSD